MRILILDNEPLRQRNLRAILATMGYKSADVEAFDDWQNALGALKKKPFDLSFVYLSMPKKSGIDVVKELRLTNRLKNIPIVIYSSEVSRDNVMEAVQSGANGFLGYPFSVSDVESVMKQALIPMKDK